MDYKNHPSTSWIIGGALLVGALVNGVAGFFLAGIITGIGYVVLSYVNPIKSRFFIRTMEQEYIPSSEVEELFSCCFYGLFLEELSEPQVMNAFSELTVDHVRSVQSDGRLFVIILGGFFRAKIIFKNKNSAMFRVEMQMNKGEFIEMRSHAKAMYQLMLQNPEHGIKPEWSNSLLFGKQEMVVKKFLGKPEEIVANFQGGFGDKYIFFYKRELT